MIKSYLRNATAFALLFLFSNVSLGQALISEIEQDDISVLLNNRTFVTMANGDTLSGKLLSATLANGYLKNVTLKFTDDSKRKFSASEISSMKVKTSRLAKLSMINEAGSSVKELAKTDFSQIINRDYIFFEQGLRATKKDKPALLQLLNPGFDQKIKVFADPNARETNGVSVEGVVLTGGFEKSYLFVKGSDKAVIVRKGSYRRNFDELYGDCVKMLQLADGQKIRFEDLPGHIHLYNTLCITASAD